MSLIVRNLDSFEELDTETFAGSPRWELSNAEGIEFLSEVQVQGAPVIGVISCAGLCLVEAALTESTVTPAGGEPFARTTLEFGVAGTMVLGYRESFSEDELKVATKMGLKSPVHILRAYQNPQVAAMQVHYCAVPDPDPEVSAALAKALATSKRYQENPMVVPSANRIVHWALEAKSNVDRRSRATRAAFETQRRASALEVNKLLVFGRNPSFIPQESYDPNGNARAPRPVFQDYLSSRVDSAEVAAQLAAARKAYDEDPANQPPVRVGAETGMSYSITGRVIYSRNSVDGGTELNVAPLRAYCPELDLNGTSFQLRAPSTASTDPLA